MDKDFLEEQAMILNQLQGAQTILKKIKADDGKVIDVLKEQTKKQIDAVNKIHKILKGL